MAIPHVLYKLLLFFIHKKILLANKEYLFIVNLVPRRRLELPRPKKRAQAPQACVSTNSTTWAHGASGRIRTCNPRFRRPIFYPVELQKREPKYIKKFLIFKFFTHFIYTCIVAEKFFQKTRCNLIKIHRLWKPKEGTYLFFTRGKSGHHTCMADNVCGCM